MPALPRRPGREKQAALAAEEARRKAAHREAAARFRADVAQQLSEKEAARLGELQAKRRELEAAMRELEVRLGLEIWVRCREQGGQGAWSRVSAAAAASRHVRVRACTLSSRPPPPKPGLQRASRRTCLASHPATPPPCLPPCPPCPPGPQLCKETAAAAKAAELGRMRAFKAQLDAQIDENEVGGVLAGGGIQEGRVQRGELLRGGWCS